MGGIRLFDDFLKIHFEFQLAEIRLSLQKRMSRLWDEDKKVMLRLGVRLWTPKTNRVLMAGVTRRKEHS